MRMDLRDDRPAEYLAESPFGQIPAYRDGDVAMFESGAIVLHIGESSEALLPRDPPGRARATSWLFAALNNIEPATWNHAMLRVFYGGQEWAEQARPIFEEAARKRLEPVAAYLGDKDWLEGRFTAGDLMMVCVLEVARHRLSTISRRSRPTRLAARRGPRTSARWRHSLPISKTSRSPPERKLWGAGYATQDHRRRVRLARRRDAGAGRAGRGPVGRVPLRRLARRIRGRSDRETIGGLFGAPFDLLLGRRTYDIFASYLAVPADGQSRRRGVRQMRQIRPDPFRRASRMAGQPRLDGIDTVAALKDEDGPTW